MIDGNIVLIILINGKDTSQINMIMNLLSPSIRSGELDMIRSLAVKTPFPL